MRYVHVEKLLMRMECNLLLRGRSCLSRFSICHRLVWLALFAAILSGALEFRGSLLNAEAVQSGCSWYRVVAGDTLTRIAWRYGSNIWAIARTNHIANVNLIFVNQRLCIPAGRGGGRGVQPISGLLPNGTVRWYAHMALEHSSPQQVQRLLRQAAARYGLPANLLLAIGWQESGWRQHVIARDGGIGTMQIMPYTAMGLNRQVRGHYDPYKLRDNIELSAIYLRSLWRGFSGNLACVISAYNQGGWSVQHRGIRNWSYVNNVLALMKRY